MATSTSDIPRGRSRLAYRVYYERFVGPIPQGSHLHHECGVTECVHPAHLRPVTPREHRRAHAKLSVGEVLAIRSGHDRGLSYAVLAETFGVSKSNVHMICSGRIWQGV